MQALADCLTRGGSPPPGIDERLWVLRMAAKRLEGSRRTRATVEPLLPDDLGLPDRANRGALERLSLSLAMLELPIRDRTMVALEHVAGLTLDEIARVVGMDRVVVRSGLDAARNRLFDAVERDPEIIDEP